MLSHADVAFVCESYLGQLLSTHPPGQHELVDTQYSEFLGTLANEGVGIYCLWEHMEKLIRYKKFSPPPVFKFTRCWVQYAHSHADKPQCWVGYAHSHADKPRGAILKPHPL